MFLLSAEETLFRSSLPSKTHRAPLAARFMESDIPSLFARFFNPEEH